ncbi:MAG: FAD-dependent oxidoreductase [Eubacteriales bacterium]
MKKMIYENQFDVVVIGGGVSGFAAALSAARNGATTLVLEQNGYLGGTLTGCGVGPMMTFHAGDKQVIQGVMQELVDRLIAGGYSVGHVLDSKQYTRTITPFVSEGMKLVMDEMLAEAGCTVLFHTAVGAVQTEASKITGLTVCNKDGLNTVSGKIYIDASGDGDIATWSGAPMVKGRPEDGASQPLTLKMKYCDVDTKVLKEYVMSNPDKFPHIAPHFEIFSQPIPVDLEGFDEEFKEEKAAGNLSIQRENVLMFGTGREGEYIINTTRIIDHDATDAASLSEAEHIGRKQAAELDVFLRKHAPGFEHALLEFTGPSVGIRSSRQLVGSYILSAEDILVRKEFSDTIAHSGYPIDIHNPKGEGTMSTFMSEPGSYYSIPYGTMVCEEIENLIVTGRCISTTFEAQAAIRTTPTVGALGQAAGIAATMAIESGNTSQIDIAELRNKLKEQKAYLE